MADRKQPSSRAEEAFQDYLLLGADRSLEKLLHHYQVRAKPAPTLQLTTLKVWSSNHAWQDQIKVINAERAANERAEVNEMRRAIHRRTLVEYDRRTDEPMIQAMPLDAIHGIHDRVKPETPRSDTLTIGGTLNVVISERPDGPA